MLLVGHALGRTLAGTIISFTTLASGLLTRPQAFTQVCSDERGASFKGRSLLPVLGCTSFCSRIFQLPLRVCIFFGISFCHFPSCYIPSVCSFSVSHGIEGQGLTQVMVGWGFSSISLFWGWNSGFGHARQVFCH